MPTPAEIEFAYTVYWTKQARQWKIERRAALQTALDHVLRQAGFEANDYERRYSVPGLDDLGHAGASLLALKKVLAAFASEPTSLQSS